MFLPADSNINKKLCDKFCLKTVIAVSPDLSAFAMFPYNSQLTQSLECPWRTVQLYFPLRQKVGSSSKASGPEPSSMIQLKRMDGKGLNCGDGTLNTLWGFRADMDTTVIITYCSLLPTVSHLCSTRRHPAFRHLKYFRKKQHQAGLARHKSEIFKLKCL